MALSFYSKNHRIKPLALHEYMEKKKNETRTKMKGKGRNVEDVVTVE